MSALDTPAAPRPDDDRVAGRPCPVCAGRRADRLRQMRFILPEDHPLPASYDLVACRRCGMAYADVSTPPAELAEFYRFSSIYAAPAASGAGSDPYDQRRLLAVADRITAFAGAPAGRVIDIGSGAGGLLDALASRGWRDLVGLDPSPACVELMQRRGHHAVAAALGQGLPALAPARIACLVHVLEHVQDPVAALLAVRPLLGPGAALYVEVPDACAYRQHLAAPFQDINTEHINHFSQAHLVALLAAAGFRVETTGQWAFPVNASTSYPAVWAFAHGAGGEAPAAAPIDPDRRLVTAMRGYLAASQTLLDGLDQRLADLLRGWPEGIAVWGTGQLLMRLLAETSLARCRIVHLVDGNRLHHGRRLLGLQVADPVTLRSCRVPILVCSALHQEAIARRIRDELGLQVPIHFACP